MRTSALILLLACGGSSAPAPTPARAPTPSPTVAIRCEALGPCPPELGVCLRCTTPDNPEWVWSEAPGSPHTLALSPANVSMPHPDLQQDCCWGHPFDNHVPDCERFEFDERGMPLRTRPVPNDVDDLYRFTYESGRVVRIEVDEVPFCVSNDFGDLSPCGIPDGTFDRSSPLTWSDDGLRLTTVRGFERVFDRAGRLVRWRTDDGSGRNTFAGGRVTTQLRDLGNRQLTDRFHYDDDRLARVERTFDDGRSETLRWEYDAQGWPIRRTFPVGVTEYDNEYADGRLVRRTIRPIESPTQSGSPTTFSRRHDEHGLLVEETREPNARVGALVTRWERNERGVPTAYVWNDVRIDQTCLEPLARHFIRD